MAEQQGLEVLLDLSDFCCRSVKQCRLFPMDRYCVTPAVTVDDLSSDQQYLLDICQAQFHYLTISQDNLLCHAGLQWSIESCVSMLQQKS
jgi:hypothetical protein